MYRMLTIFMFCLAATWSVSAQTAPVPDKYEIETAADCARYNDDVLRCAEWLRTTPYDPTKSGEWLRVAGFLTRWSAGTDEVMYEISEETAPVLGAGLGVEKMSLLFSAYLAGGAEYALGGLSNNIFASRYVSYIPNKEQLIAQVEAVLNEWKQKENI